MEFAEFLLEETRNFGLLDWGMLKGCLISLGVLIGCSFSSFFKKIKPLVWIVFAVTYLYTIWRIFSPLYEEYFGE